MCGKPHTVKNHKGDEKMAMKLIATIVVLAIIVVAAFGAWNYTTSMAQQGRFVVTLADAATDLNGVSQINVTIDSVRAQNDANGWVTLSSTQRTIDLLQLRAEGNQVVIADLNVPAGTYNQIELNISKVIVVDAQGSHEAKLPSGKIRMNMNTDLNKGSTNTIRIDVLADESLHITGNGLYILAPVIHLQTRENVQVNIDSEMHATINGGQLKDDTEVGMDEEGRVGVGVKIPENADVSIGNDNKIHVGLN